MQKSQAIGERMNAAQQLEKAGRLPDAAAIYQKLFNSDPANEQVIARLLVVYRKLKDYRKELSVLKDAIAAYQRRQKAAQKSWIQAHPQAAGAGRSILRQLERSGDLLTGLGGNSTLERWVKRQELVTTRITGKKVKRASRSEKVKKIAPQPQAKVLSLRKKTAQDRREAAANKKREQRERKAARQRAEADRIKAEAARKKEEAQRPPSLFIVLLEYLVDLDEIDALMKQHRAYLKKHYDSGDFLVFGRRVPRTGGVILARAKDRRAMERTIKGDPFIKRKLASAEIIEFAASQIGKGLKNRIK